MDNMFLEINLSEYTLEDFSALKLNVPGVEVVFLDRDKEALEKPQHGVHAQLKCSSLTFPFIKEGYKPVEVAIKHAAVLVDADPTTGIKEVIEIVLDSSPLVPLEYSPGDTIAIMPRNSTQEVDFLLEALDLLDKADQSCQVQVNSTSSKKTVKFPHIPQFTTPRELLGDLINIRAVPKKQFLRALAHCCKEKREENFLNSLASKEGSQYYNELFLEKGLTLPSLLAVCSSCKPTLPLLIEHLPRLLPRPYSIANSPLLKENELKIIFSILNERPGVATHMLAEMAKAVMKDENIAQLSPPKVLVYPRQPNNFCYTSHDFTKNQILIAIGTGVAPFLGFLEHKTQILKENTAQPGATWLFVGATIEAAIPHRVEIIELNEKYEDRVLQRYYESLSRVPDAAFHYIQEHFISNAEELVEFLLKNDTTLYVCADGARISQTIESSLSLCLQQVLELTSDEAKENIKQFRSNGKYREDLWT